VAGRIRELLTHGGTGNRRESSRHLAGTSPSGRSSILRGTEKKGKMSEMRRKEGRNGCRRPEMNCVRTLRSDEVSFGSEGVEEGSVLSQEGEEEKRQ
jgi:hypothetical protein